MINPDPDPDRHQDVHHGRLEDHSDKVEQKFKKHLNPWQLPAILGVINLTCLPRRGRDRHQGVHPEHLAGLSDKVEQKFKEYLNLWDLATISGIMNLIYPTKVWTGTRMSTLGQMVMGPTPMSSASAG